MITSENFADVRVAAAKMRENQVAVALGKVALTRG